mmetsp:Transcript_103780/g.334581  ORF Transcript_103780/g.334581 Transcript_103780/m.334581 type:complete len:290 (+) Transcript_103780:2081-2950(+)
MGGRIVTMGGRVIGAGGSADVAVAGADVAVAGADIAVAAVGAGGAVAVEAAGMARPARPTGQAPAAGTVGAARVAAAAGSAGTPTGAVVRFVGAQVEGGGQQDEDDEAQGHEVDDSLRGSRHGQGAALAHHLIEVPCDALLHDLQMAGHRVRPHLDAALVAQQLGVDVTLPSNSPSLHQIILRVHLVLNSREVLKEVLGTTGAADRHRVVEEDLVPQDLVHLLQASLLDLHAKQLLLKPDLGLAGHALKRRRRDVLITAARKAAAGQQTDEACRRVQARAPSRSRRRHP